MRRLRERAAKMCSVSVSELMCNGRSVGLAKYGALQTLSNKDVACNNSMAVSARFPLFAILLLCACEQQRLRVNCNKIPALSLLSLCALLYKITSYLC
jgi:hypothetical protein